MPMDYIVPSLRIAAAVGMVDAEALEAHVAQLIQLDKDHFIVGFQQHVMKDRQKAWHDRHIKKKQFTEGDLVLLYDRKFIKHLGKLQMHWLGPYLVYSITSEGAVQLQQLDGTVLLTLVNGSHLKPYRIGPELCTA